MHRFTRRRFAHLQQLESRTTPAAFFVQNLNDAGADSLRSAIESANAQPGLDTITFAPGLFGDISLSSELVITDAISLQGPGSHSVGIDAKGSRRAIKIDVPAGPTGAPSIIAGLTVYNGSADVGGGIQNLRHALLLSDMLIVECSAGVGGGVYSAGDLTLNNVKIQDCSATNGGGVAVGTPAVSISATNSVFQGNSAASSGGAVYVDGLTLASVEVDFVDCTFAANSAGGTSAQEGGGAINVGGAGNARVTLELCSFQSNSAAGNGGAVLGEFAHTLISRETDFVSNSAGQNGGAVALLNSAGVFQSELSTFDNNSAEAGGGAIYLDQILSGPGFQLVTGSTFIGNHADGDDGGAILWSRSADDMIVNYSTFENNFTGASGGAIAVDGASPTGQFGTVRIQNVTFSANHAALFGGALYVPTGSDGDMLLHSVTAAFNTAAALNGGGAIAAFGGNWELTSTLIANNLAFGADDWAGTIALFHHSLVSDSAGATVQQNNAGIFNVDPNLDPVLRDNGGVTKTHRLLAPSAAINGGSNPLNLTIDQRSQPRVAGTAADIGAYEVQAAPRVNQLLINGGADQRSMVTAIQINFDQDVTLPADLVSAFSLTRQGDNAAVTLSADRVGNTVTLFFEGGAVNGDSLADGIYNLRILADKVSTPDGKLDGDGNGVGGDDFVVIGNTATNKLYRLFGDVNGDSFTDIYDFVVFRQALGSSSSDSNYNPAFDFNGDGFVDLVDFVQFRQRIGKVL